MAKIKLNIKKRIFNPIYYPYLEDDTPTQIFFGGSSSGKSYFLAQRCVYDMAKGGRNYLILRKVQRDCRKSVWNEVVKQIKKFGLWDYVSTNRTEMTITFPNGYQILFGGLDDRERVKSITPQKGVITDIWLEEATEFEEDDLKQLEKRLRGQANVPKRVTMSFNPILKTHWIYREYFADWQEGQKELRGERVSILKTTYRDNEFLTQDDIDRLLNESDPYYIAVYVEGDWGFQRQGGYFKEEWFQIVPEAPADIPAWVRYWDKAGTPKSEKNKDPDFTAGVLMGFKKGIYYIKDVSRGRYTPRGNEKIIKQRAQIDTELSGKVFIFMEQEPGSSGKDTISHYSRNILAGYPFRGNKVTGSKELRAKSLSASCEAGNVVLIQGDWNEEFIRELVAFPEGPHDDQVDGASGAYNMLANKVRLGRKKRSVGASIH